MSEQRYDAFISYRRTPRDTLVAKEIQHSLEHFRVPAGIRKSSGKDGISRIFRDQEELEITSNLSQRIEDALRASDFLIVICSPGYVQSEWCLHELETFIALKGRDHVLCVLSEGEPPSVFPEQLRHASEQATAEDGSPVTIEKTVEPLACDYRGSFRAAGRTELPRLAAVMLGCRYDELVMRQEKYRRRRLAAILSASSALAILAISYLLWSNAQISRNYRQSQISESKLLAMQSLDAFEEQDRLKALSSALTALGGGEAERPVTDEAQFALSQASYAYFTPYNWLETWRIDEANDIDEFFISRDGRYLICMDHSGLFQTFGLKTRETVASFRVLENGVPATPIEGKDGELLCYTGAEVVSADYLTGEVNWRLPLKYQGIGGLHRSTEGKYIAAEDVFAVQILTDDGEPFLSLPLPEINDLYITDLCWSPDDRQIAVKLKIAGSSQSQIGVFDFDSSEFILLEPVFQNIDLFRFDGNGVLYMLGVGGNTDSYTYGSITVYSTALYELMAFRNGEMLWHQVLPVHKLTDSCSLCPQNEPGKNMLLALGDSILAFDENGNMIGAADVHEEIRTILPAEEDAVEFITWSGKWGTASLTSGSSTMVKSFPAELERVEMLSGDREDDAVYVVSVSGNLSVYESVADDTVSFFEGDSFSWLPTSQLTDGNQFMLLVDRTVLLYDLDRRAEIASVQLDGNSAWHPLTAIDGTAYLLRIDGKTGCLGVLALDMKTGEIIREDTFPVKDFYCGGFLQAPFSRADALFLDSFYTAASPAAVCGDTLYLHDHENSNQILILSLTDGESRVLDLNNSMEEPLRLLYEENTLVLPSPLSISPDQKYIFTASTDMESGRRYALLIRTEDGTVTELPGEPDDLSSACFSENSVLYSGQRELYVCGCDGSLQYGIPYQGDSVVSCAGYAGKVYCVYPDRRLVVYENGEEIRTVPLSFKMESDAISGKSFRYEFYPSRLYLYCGTELNVISLESDGKTAVYYADSVLNHVSDRNELLVSSFDREEEDQELARQYRLAVFEEYSVEELIERGKNQLADYTAN